MSNKNNALAIVNGASDELSVKKALYNLANTANKKLSDMINKSFKIKLVTFTIADVTNRNTGELETKERALIVDDTGVTYHTVANGLINSLKSLCSLFASEKDGFYSFDVELECTVIKKDTLNGHTYVIELI